MVDQTQFLLFHTCLSKPSARDPKLSPSSQNGVTVPDLAEAGDWPAQSEQCVPLAGTKSPVSPDFHSWRERDSREAFHSRGPYSRPNTPGSWPRVSNKSTYMIYFSHHLNILEEITTIELAPQSYIFKTLF